MDDHFYWQEIDSALRQWMGPGVLMAALVLTASVWPVKAHSLHRPIAGIETPACCVPSRPTSGQSPLPVQRVLGFHSRDITAARQTVSYP